MNSINQQQKELNRKDLTAIEAAAKIKELADDAKTCFFCTSMRSGKQFSTRPMTVQKVDEMGNLWLLSASDSGVDKELESDPYVQLLFQGSPHSDFLNLYGKATLTRDKAKIKELWNPMLKTWFTEGEDDPRITVIKVTPEDGHYWDTKHGTVAAFAKQLYGSLVGATYDDSIEGDISKPAA